MGEAGRIIHVAAIGLGNLLRAEDLAFDTRVLDREALGSLSLRESASRAGAAALVGTDRVGEAAGCPGGRLSRHRMLPRQRGAARVLREPREALEAAGVAPRCATA